ncbi:MAG: hypothetical protein ABIJ26_00135 [Candidatus Margulisiibacteriota bacterium]|nr:hypothetical protein [Candidatus Margulisiibacteriota bacterium]
MAGIPSNIPPAAPPPPPGGRKGVGRSGEQPAPARPEGGMNVGRGPEHMDAAAMAVALAAAAAKAREKELSFEEIIQRVIDMTGITNAQDAMEEANRKIHKEIEAELQRIKDNKDLMEEAEAWEEFAQMLESEMGEEQAQTFVNLLNAEVRGL